MNTEATTLKISCIKLFGTDTLNLKPAARTDRHPGRWLKVELNDGTVVRAWGSWGGYVAAHERNGVPLNEKEALVLGGKIANRYKGWLAGNTQPADLTKYETQQY